ncbi:MAG: hypothetical protein Ct9H300mP3_10700 [Gammaproteobacteria bacterium]|nr:MAG: hypothetical protein Ct9H300mP3_10700 [Gammaproteobacteria bacterium]
MNFGSYGIASLGLAFGGPVNSNQNFKYRVALKKDQMEVFERISIYNDLIRLEKMNSLDV